MWVKIQGNRINLDNAKSFRRNGKYVEILFVGDGDEWSSFSAGAESAAISAMDRIETSLYNDTLYL